jgi:hypothetical protein
LATVGPKSIAVIAPGASDKTLNLAQRPCNPGSSAADVGCARNRKTTMGSTRTEQAVDELGTDDVDDFESCDDIRLAWLARESGAEHSGCHDFEALWSDR